MTDDISKKDKKDWEIFISSNEKLANKDINLKKKILQKTRLIDLHGYNLEDANKSIEDFILKSFDEGIYQLIVVTGKGLHSTTDSDAYVSKNLSKLKFSVPDFIKTNEELNKHVVSISEAEKKDGGQGALLIKLRCL